MVTDQAVGAEEAELRGNSNKQRRDNGKSNKAEYTVNTVERLTMN